ncbi:MAG: hypothetical protein JKY56_20590 [Kofleriaceae bacterium]|nr:hypothetical protein [Kofleriaceae bacterium]
MSIATKLKLLPSLALALSACGSQPGTVRNSSSVSPAATGTLDDAHHLAARKQRPPIGQPVVRERTTIEHPDALGISGACQQGTDVFLVAERNQTLFRLSKDGTTSVFSILGVPEGLDLEGLACTESRIYVSTESEAPDRESDLVLVLEIADKQARVVDTIVMQYPEGLRADDNHGLEGLCIAGDWLVAAAELVHINSAGNRVAPILRRKLSGGPTLVNWVPLTTDTGKLSGIDCHAKNELLEVFAIERHFGVARILRYQIGMGARTEPDILAMESILGKSQNFEGILVQPDGSISLYNDNQYKTITGPSEEVVLDPVPAFAY